MKKKVQNIIDRVMKKKAIGIIYNIPKNDLAMIQNSLLDDKHIVIRGHDAYTVGMLSNRLGRQLKAKHFSFNMLPALVIGKMVTITDADIIKDSFGRVMDDFYKYKTPLLLLMINDVSMDNLRNLKAYSRVLTIERDYKTL